MRIRLLFFFLILTSCGYNLGRTRNSEKALISVPYIKGDFNGLFTNELIKQISYSPTLDYRFSNADYLLKVDIITEATKQIGYKYDRNNKNKRKDSIRATEGRQIIIAEVQVIDLRRNCVKFGPFQVKADADFDYVDPDSLNDLSFIDEQGQRRTVLSFSLGQLQPIESAEEATLKPLYECLSKKIVDAILAYW